MSNSVRPRPRPRVPIPAWIEAWPRGLQPASCYVTAQGVELVYRAPGEQWFRLELRLAPRAPGGLAVRGLQGDPARLDRLVAALEQRVRRSPGARPWLQRAERFIESLMPAGQPGVSDAPGIALLDCIAKLMRSEQVSSAALRSASEIAVGHFGASVAAPSMIAMLGGGLPDPVLELWGRFGAAFEREDSRRSHAICAVLQTYLGRCRQAQTHGRSLVEHTRDPLDASHAGELLDVLGQRELAAEQFELAATDNCSPARKFTITRRAALTAVFARDRDRLHRMCAVMATLADSPERLRDLADMQIEAGAFPAAEKALMRALGQASGELDLERELAHSLARIRLWRGDHEGCDALLSPLTSGIDHDSSPGPLRVEHLRMRGVAEQLAGHSEQALAWLDRAQDLDAGDNETKLWRAEALDSLGRYSSAREQVVDVTYGDLPAWQLLRALIEEHDYPGRRIEADTWFIVDNNIRQILGEQAAEDTGASHAIALAGMQAALARLGGNRSARMTMVDAHGALVWTEYESPRHRAESLQLKIGARSVAEVVGQFDALAQQYPQVPFFVTYPAELLLWRGEYARALELFEAVWIATRTRWGYVGAGAAAMLLGEDERALALWEAGKDYYSYIDAEATYCYRGELYRRRGDFEAARPDLELAVASRPGRLGAWINLALLELALGREAPLREAVAQVERLCPAYAWEARRAASLDGPLEQLSPEQLGVWMRQELEMLRGNRSSVMYTIVEGEAHLRVLVAGDEGEWQGYARRVLPFFEAELLTEMAVHAGL